jgi:hypothetical protein
MAIRCSVVKKKNGEKRKEKREKRKEKREKRKEKREKRIKALKITKKSRQANEDFGSYRTKREKLIKKKDQV